MSIPAVLVRKSTKQIIKDDIYPREDSLPVSGMDPDYEWLIKYTPYTEPDYDPRLFILVTNLPDLEYLESFQQHPDYPGIRAYTITFDPIKRIKEEIITSIENAEKQANELVFSEAIHKDELTSMLSSVYKDAKNMTLTSDEQDHIDRLAITSVAIAKNKDNKLLKIAQVEAGQSPNIDSGWARF